MTPKKPIEDQVTLSSGNVFADLELENPEDLLAKAGLVHAIAEAVKVQNLAQKEIATRLGVSQPKASQLLRGYISGFSSYRLMQFLTKLDQDVEIIIRPRPADENRPARVSVAMAHVL